MDWATMRSAQLLVAAVAVASFSLQACVTLDGERRLVREREVTTGCTPSAPVATLASQSSDKVRFDFTRAQACTETVYSQERSTGLTETSRLVIASGAGVGAAAIGVALWLSRPAPTTYAEGVASKNAGGAFWVVDVVLAAAVGVATYFVLGTRHSLPPAEVLVADPRMTRQLQAADGEVRWPGSPVPGPRTSGGALELFLEQAQGLELGELTLDGTRVELNGTAVERLSFLPACREAVSGFNGAELQLLNLQVDAPVALRRERANDCAQHGWAFADQKVK